MLSTSARRAHDDRHLICLTRPSVNAPTYCVVREACCRKKGRVLRQVTDFCYLHTRLKAYITRHGVPLGHYGPTGQGDRTVLIIPLSWCRTGSTAASPAEMEPGTRAHASVLQRLAACPTAPSWTPCQALEPAPGLSASRAVSWWGPQRRRCAIGSVVLLGGAITLARPCHGKETKSQIMRRSG